MASNSLENFVMQCVERALATRYSERHALVTSYDDQNYLAKVKFMPFGQESGWLPIETGHIGQGYGIAIGLQPGTGDPMGAQGSQSTGAQQANAQSGSQDSMGDQVIVRFQETDFESGKIVQRVHSQKDKPPGKVKSGEMMTWSKFKKDKDSGPDAAQQGTGGTGVKVYHKNDGSYNIEDGNGATYVLDGNGNHTVTSGNSQKTTKILHQVLQGDAPTSVDDGSQSSGSSSGQQSQPLHYSQLDKKKGARTSVFQDKHYTNWDASGVTHSSTGGKVTMSSDQQVVSQAPQIPHIGNSSVTQNLSVGQNVTALTYGTISDVRLKTNIKPLSPSLDDVMKLEVKTYDRRSVDYTSLQPKISPLPPLPSLGLIAQDVRKVFPLLVDGDDDEFLSIHESKIVMVLLAAFQQFVTETRQQIAELNTQVAVLSS